MIPLFSLTHHVLGAVINIHAALILAKTIALQMYIVIHAWIPGFEMIPKNKW